MSLDVIIIDQSLYFGLGGFKVYRLAAVLIVQRAPILSAHQIRAGLET